MTLKVSPLEPNKLLMNVVRGNILVRPTPALGSLEEFIMNKGVLLLLFTLVLLALTDARSCSTGQKKSSCGSNESHGRKKTNCVDSSSSSSSSSSEEDDKCGRGKEDSSSSSSSSSSEEDDNEKCNNNKNESSHHHKKGKHFKS
ncbi:hypothetical protein RR46_05211 [Papilio xuthus]|uniref:Uncharacterized protein n=1 Tax=Papilio xuthus TaxID=66420 RepID=A0A194Q902_PAPXU|nr:hypothetical protein RR46_05211 [Papilio xuthus]